jgi:hypothetical protein
MTPHILIRSLDRGATAFLIAIAANRDPDSGAAPGAAADF